MRILFTLLAQMLGLAGFNSQQAAAAGLAGGRNPFTQQVLSFVITDHT